MAGRNKQTGPYKRVKKRGYSRDRSGAAVLPSSMRPTGSNRGGHVQVGDTVAYHPNLRQDAGGTYTGTAAAGMGSQNRVRYNDAPYRGTPVRSKETRRARRETRRAARQARNAAPQPTRAASPGGPRTTFRPHSMQSGRAPAGNYSQAALAQRVRRQ